MVEVLSFLNRSHFGGWVTGNKVANKVSIYFIFQLENIENFVKFCELYGVRKTSLFQPPDLFENNHNNLQPVLDCIQALGSVVSYHSNLYWTVSRHWGVW